MKVSFLVLIILMVLSSCKNVDDNRSLESSEQALQFGTALIPINYDYNHLRIHLNDSIEDSLSNIEWKWSHMNATSSIPDSVGQDFYENRNQESFLFHGEETLPTLYAKTVSNRIQEFSVVTIFALRDTDTKSLEEVLNRLERYELLDNKEIKERLLKDHYYKNLNDVYSEELRFEYAKNDGGYSRLEYRIKIEKPVNEIQH